MIYAVNKRTKAHRALGSVAMAENEWDLVPATPGGWIKWHGGECPLPEDAPVDFIREDGVTIRAALAGDRSWSKLVGGGFAVAYYRPALDTKTEPTRCDNCDGVGITVFWDDCHKCASVETGWNGEGLPPVGCEFEFSVNGRCWEERVMLFNDGTTCLMAHRKYPANRWHYKSDDPALQFRPIRSEEGRAVEDMERVFRGAESANLRGLMRALYRAGYRKTGGE